MGVFRDFFEHLWKDFIKTPIEGVKREITDVLKQFETWIKTPVEGLQNSINDTLKQFESWLKSPIEGLQNSINDTLKQFEQWISNPFKVFEKFPDIPGELTKWWNTLEKHGILVKITHEKTVKSLDAYWDVIKTRYGDDEEVKTAYEHKREELKAEGYEDTADLVLNPIAKGVAHGVWAIEEKALPKIMEWIDKFGKAYHIEKEHLEAMKELAKTGEFGLNAVVSFILGVTVEPAVTTATLPLWEKVQQETQKAIRSGLLSPEQLIRAKWRDIQVSGGVEDQLARQGYTDVDIQALEQVLRFYPSPTDFIRFAVRDVYNEDVVKKYGYDTEYPENIEADAAKAGIDPQWMRAYWRAHWQLPSPTLAFEMLHRGVITVDDVRTILRVNDYAPSFIEPMIKVAYHPYTRVDVRRMYQMGVLNEEEVKKAYMEEGYDEEKAQKLTEWTVEEYNQQNRDLTKSEILKNYRIGLTDRTTAKKLLVELGYSEDDAEWILSYEDYKIDKEKIEEEADTIIAEIAAGTRTVDEGIEELRKLKLTERAIMHYIEKAKRAARKAVKLPSIADLKHWLKNGIIDEQTFREYAGKLNYSTEVIDYYIEETKI